MSSSMATHSMSDTLFWSRRGDVACGSHAPGRDSERWRAEGWSPIPESAMRHRLPSMYGNAVWADAGGMLSYAPNFSEFYRRAADQVSLIFKGAKPAEMPVEQPTTFELVINLKTAKALGLDVPPSLLARADEVIE